MSDVPKLNTYFVASKEHEGLTEAPNIILAIAEFTVTWDYEEVILAYLVDPENVVETNSNNGQGLHKENK